MFTLSQAGSLAPELPATSILPELKGALETVGKAIVTAAPGSGKTTLVPPFCWALEDARAKTSAEAAGVIVTEPRRVAARAAASYLQTLLPKNENRLADKVAFSVRGESTRSRDTRLDFATAGLFLRRLLADPEVSGIGTVIIDEVHERSLETDVLLALLCEVRQLRPELRIVVMSATLDSELFRKVLGEDTPVLQAEGKLFPLQEVFAPPPVQVRRISERGTSWQFRDYLADLALSHRIQGDTLLFAPAIADVEAIAATLRSRASHPERIMTLHGQLSSRQQAKVLSEGASAASEDALEPGEGRIIVATSVAESALTVPGVRQVIDSGLSRVPSRSFRGNAAGLSTLSCSRAAVAQRAGRAARLGAGYVIRAYDQQTYARMEADTQPEILRSDLTQTYLQLADWGQTDLELLALPTTPPPAAWQQAEKDLQALGALDVDCRITVFGRQLVQIPAHPRLARALILGARLVGERRAAQVVAALQADLRSPDGDLWAAIQRAERQGDKTYRTERSRFEALARRHQSIDIGSEGFGSSLSARGGQVGQGNANRQTPSSPAKLQKIAGDLSVGVVVAMAFPEQIGRLTNKTGGYQLSGSGAAHLDNDSSLSTSKWLAIAEIGLRKGGDDLIRLAAPLTEELALELGKHLVQEKLIEEFRDGEICAWKERLLGEISLQRQKAEIREPERVLEAEYQRVGLDFLSWNPKASSLRARLRWAAHYLPAIPAVGDQDLHDNPRFWQVLISYFANGKNTANAPVAAWLDGLLDYESRRSLEREAPSEFLVPSGRRVAITYPDEVTSGLPRVQAKLQEFFGLQSTPKILGGKVNLAIEMLSPAGRPAALVTDLDHFWDEVYPQVRAEMRGRYRKHPWPEDPRAAIATAATNRQLRSRYRGGG
ncbi:ATP-dependent helicase C-terminal domain-containing protein [uncultured Varibaculum sp.]|uniref:ATP-dependent helicase C-terminal domain-containing protein n=1 Tax=uncultured Varibaculum sp. TaxID=413896 RepID=UPI0027D9AAA5|nr:ATP-dependent helicase C-terminal domain-containing protein [uncultured Varibaculum sp.]